MSSSKSTLSTLAALIGLALMAVTADTKDGRPFWLSATHLQAKAAGLNADGATYKPMLLANWYLIDQDQARSELFDDAMAVAALEEALR